MAAEPGFPSAAKERAAALDIAAAMQRQADAAAKCASELTALYPRTRWQRFCGWFSYRAEVIGMHLRGDFRGR